MQVKKPLLSIFLVSVFCISSVFAADIIPVSDAAVDPASEAVEDVDFYEPDEQADNIVSIEEQYKILQDYMGSLCNIENLRRKEEFGNAINFISHTEKKISVGILDITDESFKNQILSIPGIDSEAIEFITFTITSSGFAKELPEEYQNEVSTR